MYIAIDIETTGLNPEKDDIIEFGSIIFDEKGQIIEEFSSLIYTNKEIPEIVSQITGITNKDIENAPKLEELKEKIQEKINQHTPIGHNIEFDISFLRNNGLKIENDYIDTLFLSSSILKTEKSHSLEALSKSLKIKKTSSHNALEDSRTAMNLFLNLKKSYSFLSKELLEEISKISEKGKLSETSFFNEIETENPKSRTKSEKAQKITKISIDENTIYETLTAYEELAIKLTQENKVVSIPKDIFEKLDTSLSNIQFIDSFENYIDPKRLNSILQSKTLKNYEAKALIKIIISEFIDTKAPLSSIRFFNEEKKIIKKINKTEKEDDKTETNTEIICTHDYLLNNLPNKKTLVIIDLNEFQKAFEKKESLYLSLDKALSPLENIKIETKDETIELLINKTIILFGLIGILFDKHTKKSEAYLELEERTLSTLDFKNISKNISSIITSSKELIKIKSKSTELELKEWKKILLTLSEIFHNTNLTNKNYLFTKLLDNSIAIKTSPKNIKEKLEDFYKKFKEINIFDNSISLNDEGNFYKSYNRLPKILKTEFLKEKTIFPLILSPTDETESIEKILEISQNEDKNTLIITPANSNLKKLSIILKNKIKSKEVFSETTASIAKLNELINTTSKKILIVSPKTIEKLDNQSQFDDIVISKIPFFYHKDKDFIQETLPLTALRIKRICKKNSNKNAIFYLLDKRIQTPSYGEKLLNMLKDDFNTLTENFKPYTH